MINVADESVMWKVRQQTLLAELLKTKSPTVQRRLCSEFVGYLDRRVSTGTLKPNARATYIGLLIGHVRRAQPWHPALPEHQGWLKVPERDLDEINRLANERISRMVEEGDGLIEVSQEVVDSLVAWAEETLDEPKSHFWELLAALTILTGRRFVELVFMAIFEMSPDNPGMLRTTTVAKQRGRSKTYEFPTLSDPAKVLAAVTKLREMPEGPSSADDANWTNRSRYVTHALNRHGFDVPRPNQILRSIYGAAIYRLLATPGENVRVFLARYLGHDMPRTNASDHYRKIKLTG